jgi:hypothetical protein
VEPRPPIALARTHRILIGVVVAGAIVIAAIGFAGSYAAVRDLAEQKGFGAFAVVFPIGIDAGIVVLLALDLLLTWIRIPFPLLRQTAWLLTAATIAFNGAAAWPDPLGVGMHAVIPVLFVVSVEAARHAIGRIADITADRHMESVRIARWLLAFPSTFRLWRRIKLWELRSYDEVIRLEQDRLVYRARLRARYGRAWRRKAPVESLMPLRLTKYGVPISQTGPAGLEAAGIELPALPKVAAVAAVDEGRAAVADRGHPLELEAADAAQDDRRATEPQQQPDEAASPAAPAPQPHSEPATATAADRPAPVQTGVPDEPERAEIFARALRDFVLTYGDYPTARQFALMLHDRYGVGSPEGGPLAEAELRPHLREMRHREGLLTAERADAGEWPAPDMADEPGDRFGGDPPPVMADMADPPAGVTGSSTGVADAVMAGASYGSPVPAASASVADDRMAGGGVPQQLSLDAPAVTTAGQATATGAGAGAGAGEPRWDAAVTDTGEATARVPEQQAQEPELDAEQQRIHLVADWLAKAEDAGERLSGAEVARRLGVSPRTGQRALTKAKAYREEQLRQQGRAHLRPVTGRRS